MNKYQFLFRVFFVVLFCFSVYYCAVTLSDFVDVIVFSCIQSVMLLFLATVETANEKTHFRFSYFH